MPNSYLDENNKIKSNSRFSCLLSMSKIEKLKLLIGVSNVYYIKNFKKNLAISLVLAFLLSGIGLANLISDINSVKTKALPVLGSTPSNGGNITIDKTYYDGTAESDNATVNIGGVVTVRLKYDNTSSGKVTNANIIDSLPLGFTYIPGSAKNCLSPTIIETICDSGDAGQKDSLFGALTGPNGVSPTAGLYDAIDNGFTGTAFDSNSGLLEIGKKRYLNLHQCNYGPYGFTDFVNHISINQYGSGTNISNSSQSSVICNTGDGQFTYQAQLSDVNSYDFLNKKYFNLNQCVYNTILDSYTNIITIGNSVLVAGTNSANSIQNVNNCSTGFSGSSSDTDLSAVKSMSILGNRFLNIAHCAYIDGLSSTIGAVDNIANNEISANTSVSNTPSTISCGPGGVGRTFAPLISNMQNLDLLDTVRGQGYIEYQMTAPITTGFFGTDVTLTGDDGAGVLTTTDQGADNQVNVSIVNNNTPLEVTINQATSQIDPTSTGPVKFTAVFNQSIDVTTFSASDIVLSGTASSLSVASITQITPNNGTTFEIVVNATGTGTVIASIPTGSFNTQSIILGTTGINPDGVVVDALGNIYTTNYGSNDVTKITPDGTSTILGTTGSYPYNITIDASGNIYTTNYGSNDVTKITPDGTSTILGTTGSNPNGIAVDVLGNVYIANTIDNDVTKITPDGTSTILGTTGSNPNGIAVDALGNVYITNTNDDNVTKITPDGFSTTLGTTGSNPNGIAVDTLGNVYTANTNNDNVTKITPDGFSTTLGVTGIAPIDITIDSSGNVYTANFTSNDVTKITPDGFSTTLGTTGSNPNGIAVDTLGNVYTSNYGSDNVSKISSLFIGIKAANANIYNQASTSIDNIVTIEVSFTLGSFFPQAPINGFRSATFHSFNLIGCNLITGTVAQFFVNPGTVTESIINGTIENLTTNLDSCRFIPDFGSLIPVDAEIVPSSGILKSLDVSDLTIPTDFDEAATLSFEIRNADDTNITNSCDMGYLSFSGVGSCSYRLKVETNAISGYTISVTTSGGLSNGNNSFVNPPDESGISNQIAGTELYGVRINKGSITTAGGNVTLGLAYGSATDNTVPLINTSPEILITADKANNPSRVDTDNTTLITHQASISDSTPPGLYSQTITYTISPSFEEQINNGCEPNCD
jgi:hypothetical protein